MSEPVAELARAAEAARDLAGGLAGALRSVARLGGAEARLAAASARLLLVLAIASVVLFMFAWLSGAVLLGWLLYQAGTGPGAVLAILCLGHVAAGAACIAACRRLRRDLDFPRTRTQLATLLNPASDVPERHREAA